MHRLLVENVTLPLLFRRSWPRLRAEIARLRDTESRSPDATRELWERRALDAARSAGVHVPYYRHAYRGHGAIDTMEDFRRLPVVSRETVRDHVEQMLRDGAERASLQRGATGGSTGVPMPYYHDDAWWFRASAAALRGDMWAGWQVGEVHATLWGTPLSETFRGRMTRIAGERAKNQVFLPSFDLSEANVDRNIDRLVSARPRLVTGYASVLAAHAKRIASRGVEMPQPRAVISAAETLRPEMRAGIERAFGAPVFDRYGCRELGMIAQECSVHEGLHIATEHVYVEVDAGGRPARPGESGRLLLTLLGDVAFPFIRYEVGDGAVAGKDEPCLCGLPYPRLAKIDGRLLDVLRCAGGGALSGTFFPHLMKEFPFVREFQVFQGETGAVEIRIVPEGPHPDAAAIDPVVRAASGALGGLPVTVRFVPALERTPSGKVRMTHSRWDGVRRESAAAGTAS